MAYQPIEMTARPPILDAIAGVGDAFSELGNIRRQSAMAEQARKRQDFADFQSAYLQAKKLADSGDHAGAAAMMARFKGRYGESPSALATPAAPARAPGGTPQGGSPMPDSMEFKPGHTAQDFDTEHGQVPAQLPGPPMPMEEGPDGVMPNGQPPPAPPPTAAQSLMGAAPGGRPPPPADHPLVAANEASKARDAQRGHNILYFTPPGGQEQSYDPQAVREQHLAQRTAEVEAMVAKAPPEAKAVYQELAPALAMNDQLDATDIVKLIGQRMADKRAEEGAAARAHEGELNRGQRATLTADRIEAGHENAHIAADARARYGFAINPPGFKDDQSTRQDSAALEHAVNDVFAKAGGGKAIAGMDALHAANANINATGPNAVLAHRDAMVQLARYFRGSTPTDSEQKLLYDHLGGTPAAMDAFIKRIESGELSDAAVENLRSSVALAYREAEQKRGRLMSALKHRLADPGSEFRLMGPAARAQVASVAANYGMEDIGDAFPSDDATATAPAPALGTGRLARTTPKATPGKAPAQPVAASADGEALKWAQDPANAKDPDLPGVRAMLKKKGLLK